MDAAAQARTFEFGGFRLDVAQRRLFGPDGAPIDLPSRAYDLLLYMVEHPGSLLDKSTLLKAVWLTTIVEETSLTQSIFLLRRALGEQSGEQKFIATVPGRGYQFVAQVRVVNGTSTAISEMPAPESRPEMAGDANRRLRVRWSAVILVTAAVLICGYVFWPQVSSRNSPDQSVSSPDNPVPATIAVLPFDDLSPAKDMEYFTHGIAEELMSSLAKAGNLRVIGRRSVFAFKNGTNDARTIGEKLHVETILEGSVRKEGDRIRISAQLTRTKDGIALWAETYDRKLDDVLDVQSSIASEVVSALGPFVRWEGSGGTGNIEVAATVNAAAYNAYLRGIHFADGGTDSALMRARDEFARATELDPKFALAFARLAVSHDTLARRGIGNTSENQRLASVSLEKALNLVPAIGDLWWIRVRFIEGDNAPVSVRVAGLERALAMTPDAADAMFMLGHTYLLQGKRAKGLQLINRAHELDPMWRQPLVFAATLSHDFIDDRQRVLDLIDELEAVDPTSPRVPLLRASMAFNEGRVADWDRWAARFIELDPTDHSNHCLMSSYYGEMGAFEAARYHGQVAKQLNPDNSAGWYDIAHIELLAEDLTAARAEVQEAMARWPEDQFAQLAQAELQYFTGACAEAIGSITLAIPAFKEPVPSLNLMQGTDVVPILAWCQRKQGNVVRARELAQVFNIQYGPPSNPGTLDGQNARMAAAVGDRNALISHLSRLAQSKSLGFSFARHEPMIQPYLADPAVKSLLDRLETRRAEWRRLVTKASTRVPIPGFEPMVAK